MPPRRHPDQSAPKPSSPTGNTNGEVADFDARAQSGKYLTTAQGLRLPDTDHSLKAGVAVRRFSRTSTCGKRSRISTTSAFPSASCTRAPPPRRLPERMKCSRGRRTAMTPRAQRPTSARTD